MHPGDVLTLDIEKPVVGGRMLARHARQVVLVSGAIPGEQVRARVERVSAGVAHAEAVEILAPSPDRRDSPGDARCGGNVYAHIAYDRQRALKSLVIRDAFARIARATLDVDPAVEPSPERGYRMRARLHGRDGRIGFFREGTHDLCDPRDTDQLAEPSLAALMALQDALTVGDGAFPCTIELSENIPATLRAAHLELPEAARIDAGRGAHLREAFTGITACAGSDETQVLGDPFVQDELVFDFARVRFRRHVRAFFQGNRFLLATLVSRVLGLIPAGGDVLDLYAGGGVFSVPLAARGGSRITAVEGDPVSGDDLRWNGRLYGTTLRTHRRSVEAYLQDRPKFAGTIVVDPPRTGMSADASAKIRSSGARRILYVSCDVATLARDVRRLIEAGYLLDHVEAFDLFPNTAHIETIAVLSGRGTPR